MARASIGRVAARDRNHPDTRPQQHRDDIGQRVKGIKRRMDELVQDRSEFEALWQEISDFFLPGQGRFGRQLHNRMEKITAPSRDRHMRRYDSTAILALDRMCSGIESLISPESGYWHGLQLTDGKSAKPSQEEKVWLEEVRDDLFSDRYGKASGFVQANRKAIRSAGAFGTGVFFIEDGYSSLDHKTIAPMPLYYMPVPLAQCYLGVNAIGQYDTNFQRPQLSAKQMAQKWGKDRLSKKTQKRLDDVQLIDRPIDLIHAVFPREDMSGQDGPGAFASIWIEPEHDHLIVNRGFEEFPYAVMSWDRDVASAYGDSPAAMILDDVRGTNAMKMMQIQSAGNYLKPPMAMAANGVTARVNLNPGAMNPGMIDAEGRLMVQPIQVGSDPRIGMEVLEGERQVIRDGLFNSLFAILLQNPQMTAREAMIRAGEKADLLGPAGSNLGAGHAAMIERETGIKFRQGLVERFPPPKSLQGRGIGMKSSTPLDRMRRREELVAMQETIAFIAPLAAVDPSVMDVYDVDAMAEEGADISGVPARVVRSPEAVAEIRKQRQEAMAQQQQIEQAGQAAAVAKDAVPALEGLNRLGATMQ